MSLGERLNKRVVAICPTSRGFGFAVFEDPKTLLDWGVAQIPPAEETRLLGRVRTLLDRYEPDVFVIESTDDPHCRRRGRVRGLLAAMRRLVAQRRVSCAQVRKADIRRAFARHGAATKHQVATVIAAQVPELARHLPPPRDIWQSESPRFSLFGAAALAITFYIVGADADLNGSRRSIRCP